jgi:hypothetical protein
LFAGVVANSTALSELLNVEVTFLEYENPAICSDNQPPCDAFAVVPSLSRLSMRAHAIMERQFQAGTSVVSRLSRGTGNSNSASGSYSNSEHDPGMLTFHDDTSPTVSYPMHDSGSEGSSESSDESSPYHPPPFLLLQPRGVMTDAVYTESAGDLYLQVRGRTSGTVFLCWRW